MIKGHSLLKKTREAMYNADVPLEDGEYISSLGAVTPARILHSEPSNPFNYQDTWFNLHLADASPASGPGVKRQARGTGSAWPGRGLKRVGGRGRKAKARGKT